MKVTVLYGLEPQQVWQLWKQKWWKKKSWKCIVCAENYVYILLLLRACNYLENAGLSSLERI